MRPGPEGGRAVRPFGSGDQLEGACAAVRSRQALEGGDEATEEGLQEDVQARLRLRSQDVLLLEAVSQDEGRLPVDDVRGQGCRLSRG